MHTQFDSASNSESAICIRKHQQQHRAKEAAMLNNIHTERGEYITEQKQRQNQEEAKLCSLLFALANEAHYYAHKKEL